jgi:hypothetical protein
MPPVVPYSGPLEPDEPDEPMPVRMKVDAFIDAIKQFEQPKDTSYFKPVVFKNQEY